MKSSIAQVYDERYRAMDAGAVLTRREAAGRLVRRCFKYIDDRKFSRVLDLGCGDGEKTYWLPDFATAVMAVDISSEGISLARSLNAHPQIKYVVGDLNQVTLGERFDCLTSFGISVTNLDDFEQIIAIILDYLNRYGSAGASYLHYSQTDFSGTNPGWKYHSFRELNQMLRRLKGEPRIRDFRVVFFLPRGIELNYRNPIHRIFLRGFSAAHTLLRRRSRRLPYIVVLTTA